MVHGPVVQSSAYSGVHSINTMQLLTTSIHARLTLRVGQFKRRKQGQKERNVRLDLVNFSKFVSADMCLLKCFVVVLVCQMVLVAAGNGGGDTYSVKELQYIPKLLNRLKGNLTQKYMFENKYLVRYLRAKNMDLDGAEKMLLETLKWRKEQNLDNIFLEDFSWWRRSFKFYYPLDREGRPCVASSIGQMNFRQYVLSGKGHEVIRYIYYVLELSLRDEPGLGKAFGKEFIGGHLLFNLAGYNARTHACLACIPYWIELARNYEHYYPQLGVKVIGINCPRLFEVSVEFVRPFLAHRTVQGATLYGYNRAEWQREVLKIFPPENLTPEFGGTLKAGKDGSILLKSVENALNTTHFNYRAISY